MPFKAKRGGLGALLGSSSSSPSKPPPPKKAELNVLDTLSQITREARETALEEYTAEMMRDLAKKLGELQARADTLANRIEEDALAAKERQRNATAVADEQRQEHEKSATKAMDAMEA